MLFLSRKKNESIIINDDITVMVVEIRGEKVWLAVEAPREVPVFRNESYGARRGRPSKEEQIRRRIAGLKRQIRDLESELAAT